MSKIFLIITVFVFSFGAQSAQKKVREINVKEFEELLKKPSIIFVTSFGAPWCGACKKMTPVLEEYYNKQSRVEVVKINTDKNPGLAEKYKVDGYPSFIVIKDGKEDKRFSGYMDIAAFEQEMMFY